MRNEQGTHGQECYPAVHTFHPDVPESARPRGLREGKERQRLYHALRIQKTVPRTSPARTSLYLHYAMQRVRSKRKPKIIIASKPPFSIQNTNNNFINLRRKVTVIFYRTAKRKFFNRTSFLLFVFGFIIFA